MESSEVIFTYSRSQAIEDGVLVDLSAVAPEVCREHYRVPVACTAGVWSLISRAIADPVHGNDLNGVLHDILWMSRKTGRRLDASTSIFAVTITGTGKKRVHRLKLVIGPGDQAEPVATVMLPNED